MPSGRLEEIRRRRRRTRAWRIVAIAVLLAIVAGGAWLYVEAPWREEPSLAGVDPAAQGPDAGTYPMRERPAPSARDTVGPDESASAPVEEDVAAAPPAALPPLDRSDEVVRRAVSALTSRAELGSWLVGDDLVRRFTVAVDNIAEGRNPRQHVREVRPEGLFEVDVADGRIWLEPEGYARYDTLAAALASVDTEGAVRLYRRLEPLVDEAYRDLGYPQRDFDERLRQAIAELLAAPVVEGEVELVRRGGATYAFADPALEDLSEAQKALVRMGPENQREVQAKLRELAAALGVPRDALPRERTYRPASS